MGCLISDDHKGKPIGETTVVVIFQGYIRVVLVIEPQDLDNLFVSYRREEQRGYYNSVLHLHWVIEDD